MRLFKPSDVDRILQIEHTSFILDVFSEKTFLRLAHKFPELFIVAEMDNEIVGYIIACILRGKGYVASIGVDPRYRRQRIGSILADFVFKKLKARGIKVVELEVRTTNEEGLSFWKHLGFFPLRVVREFYAEGEDALKMRKNLWKIANFTN